MTDNEIIKALECCKGYLTNDCAMCQNVEKYPRCNEFLNEIALDLINRQKAEIEKIKIKLKYYLETNEENGVVYIPKFIIDNLVKEMTEVSE
jgi:hypothetical protein